MVLLVLRTQRLRLTAIGGGSLKVKDSNTQTNFVKDGADVNFVNNVNYRVWWGVQALKKEKINILFYNRILFLITNNINMLNNSEPETRNART